MIDHLGLAHEVSAAPLLIRIAAGEHPVLRDIFLRIKAIEALGRMRVAESETLLREIVRGRAGLMHSEPAALRSAAEEALALLENRPSSARSRTAESARTKPNAAHSRPRRYVRARLQSPLTATIAGPRGGAARVRSIALGGALLETEQRMTVGDSLQLEIRTGIRKIQSTAVVRNVALNGTGVEFVHLNADDRERLRRLVEQLLK
jgi:PilZ domain